MRRFVRPRAQMLQELLALVGVEGAVPEGAGVQRQAPWRLHILEGPTRIRGVRRQCGPVAEKAGEGRTTCVLLIRLHPHQACVRRAHARKFVALAAVLGVTPVPVRGYRATRDGDLVPLVFLKFR